MVEEIKAEFKWWYRLASKADFDVARSYNLWWDQFILCYFPYTYEMGSNVNIIHMCIIHIGCTLRVLHFSAFICRKQQFVNNLDCGLQI